MPRQFVINEVASTDQEIIKTNTAITVPFIFSCIGPVSLKLTGRPYSVIVSKDNQNK